MAAEDLSFDDLLRIVDPMICRTLAQCIALDLPVGMFTPVNLPLQDISGGDNPTIHLFDVISSYREAIDFAALESAYKMAMLNNDMGLLHGSRLQIFVCPCSSGSQYIVKHHISATKVKPSAFSQSVYGTAQIYTWRATNVKNGRKILQYMLEGLGGRQLKCFELQSQAATKNTASKFEDKTDEETDAGFDFIAHEGPRSTSDMPQLRWMTKSIKNSSSPIYNWPTVLVEKALRNLATDAALTKKESSWPLPLTSTYFHPWLLELLETVWDFDMSALIMLGGSGIWKVTFGQERDDGTGAS